MLRAVLDGTWQAWATLFVVVVVLAVLAATRVRAHVVLLGALTLLLTLGVISDRDLLSSVANPGMATVGALFAVGAGLRDTGGMSWLAERLLGRPQSVTSARVRIVGPVALLSAFMNNIPLVAVMLPVVNDWARRIRVSTSQLMIPLSYASVLGGTCTLIGTSTIIVVNGLVITELGPEQALGMFDISRVGVPVAIVGLLYLVLLGGWLLVDRTPALSTRDDAREYTLEMIVEKGSPLTGKSIEDAGLRQLPGVFLMEVQRDGIVMPAVSPKTELREKDRLVFVGVVTSVVDLQRIRGLSPATNQLWKMNAPRPSRSLVEVVVSNSNPLLGQTIREGRFRTRYDAVAIAAARHGQRIDKKLGDIVLQAGDTLLLEARPDFVEHNRESRDFYLVSEIADSSPLRHDRAWLAVAILVAMVATVALGWMSMLNAALLAAGFMVIARCTTASAALRAVDWTVLLVIVAAFGIGRAMEVSGAAMLVADSLLGIVGDHEVGTLAVLCGLTMVFTNVMNANAAAVLVFPIGVEAASHLDASPMPFVIGIVMGAAASFATPIGYQTNLMVYGPGGYRFVDFVRIGAPLSLLVWGLSVALIPHFWPF
jgi:di/tricarboxylate transporter